MAIFKVTNDLNGGDDQTLMSKLVFQIHDGITEAIISTATYAKIGSVDVAGSDSNITLTLDETGGTNGQGQIIIDGVDVGSATSIKIRCKDEAENESDLSNSHSTATSNVPDAPTDLQLNQVEIIDTPDAPIELILEEGTI